NDELLDRYIGQNTSREDAGKTVFFGLNSALDFRLAYDLQWVIKGLKDPQALFDRLEAQRNRALNRGEIGRYLVAFADNHDSFWQISGDGQHFGFPYGNAYTLALSRVLYEQEALVAYNVSGAKRNDCIVVDASLHKEGDRLRCLHGGLPDCRIDRAANSTLFVRPELEPHQFVILA